MAIATSTAIALALAAAAAGGQYYNAQHTASRQDQAAADSIRNQSKIQKQADADVNNTVSKLAGSNSAEATAQRLNDYMSTLRRSRANTEAGLSPVIGSDTFKTDAAQAANDASGYAAKTAGLMARMDAPGIQRQQEGFDYGKLSTDLGLVGRQSQGQSFLDQLRLQGIRRNAKIDLASGLLSAGAGAVAGGVGGAASAAGSGGSTYAAGGGYTYNLPN
jgi:hypothetical protein